ELDQSRVRAEARVSELQEELTSAQAELEEHQLGDDRLTAALAERDTALATAPQLEAELSQEREERGSLTIESENAARHADELDKAVATERARADELDRTIATERARSEELEQSRARTEGRVSELEGELSRAQAELEE